MLVWRQRSMADSGKCCYSEATTRAVSGCAIGGASVRQKRRCLEEVGSASKIILQGMLPCVRRVPGARSMQVAGQRC